METAFLPFKQHRWMDGRTEVWREAEAGRKGEGGGGSYRVLH